MLRLLTVAMILATLFASTFLILKFFGVLTADNIKALLLWASEVNTIYVGIFITALLFLDMFIAIPTLTIVTLSGYFMGAWFGAAFSVLGMWLAGISGYFICRKWGDQLLTRLYQDKEKLNEMQDIFNKHGISVLLLCRAMPILPEVTCCLSGANKISFKKFFLFYSLGTIPYGVLAAFAGSKSTLNDPLPGILGAIGISALLWIGWFILIRVHYKSRTT